MENPITAEKVRKGTCFNACLVDKSIGCVFMVGDRPNNMEGNKEGEASGWGIAKDQILLLAFVSVFVLFCCFCLVLFFFFWLDDLF